MPERSADWIQQASRDLESAKAQMKDGFYEWAGFIAQQAAEKASKAVYQKHSAEAWGHSLTHLLSGLREEMEIPRESMEAAQSLDRYYMATRDPNGFVSGAPSDYFTEEDAGHAIGYSERIIRFCASVLAGQA
jgi:HEPN domain-containing protein